MDDEHRMYGDLAWLWPILSPKEDYAEESEFIAAAIKEHSQAEPRTLLHLGCGGGHNDYTLKKHFEVTGVDASPAMLDLARSLNPEAEYIEGDMRSIRLGREFDAVIILDSIAYMLSEDALREAFHTAYEHLRAGGVFLTVVELRPDTFVQNKTNAWTRTKGEVELAFIENYYDPDPGDTTYESTFLYLMRQGGKLTIETDRHLCGMFPMDVWRRSVERVGFSVEVIDFAEPDGPGEGFPVILGIRPEA